MRKILKMSELELLREYVGPDCFARLTANRHLCCKPEQGGYLLAFYFSDIRNITQKDEKVCIYCSEKDLILVTDSKLCLEYAGKAEGESDHYRWLLAFFFAMTDNDVYELEKMENRMTGIEDGFLKGHEMSQSPAKIIAVRRGLLKMKRYYEQLSLVTGELAEDDDSSYPNALKSKYAAMDRRIDHLQSSVLHLREYITQVREAYQAQIDISQNQTMKVLTVVNAVFLPLTLIVGWYGMNIQMPEYAWRYGYLYVGILSALVCAICLAIFKFKKWF